MTLCIGVCCLLVLGEPVRLVPDLEPELPHTVVLHHLVLGHRQPAPLGTRHRLLQQQQPITFFNKFN